MRFRALTIVIGLALAAGLVVQAIRYSGLKKVNHQLENKVAELQRQVAAREQPAAPATSPVIAEGERIELLRLRNQAAQLRTATNELHKLRTQVSQLGASRQTAAASRAGNGAAGEMVSRAALSFAGYATPDAALQSTLFAMTQGDHNAFLASLSPEEAQRVAKQSEGKTPEQMSEKWRRDTGEMTSYRILDRDEVSSEEMVLVIYVAGEKQVVPMQMRRVGEEWKFAGVATDRR